MSLLPEYFVPFNFSDMSIFTGKIGVKRFKKKQKTFHLNFFGKNRRKYKVLCILKERNITYKSEIRSLNNSLNIFP